MSTRPHPPTKTARLFVTGGSQAVRLPAEFRFEGSEVLIHRDPRSGDVVLSPVVRKSWVSFFALDDFLIERDQPTEVPRDPFEAWTEGPGTAEGEGTR